MAWGWEMAAGSKECTSFFTRAGQSPPPPQQRTGVWLGQWERMAQSEMQGYDQMSRRNTSETLPQGEPAGEEVAPPLEFLQSRKKHQGRN